MPTTHILDSPFSAVAVYPARFSTPFTSSPGLGSRFLVPTLLTSVAFPAIVLTAQFTEPIPPIEAVLSRFGPYLTAGWI